MLGATGDLAKRKLFPAIYRLIADKKLDNFAIIGAAIDDLSAEAVLERSKEFIKELDTSIWQQLKERTFYQPLDFRRLDDFHALANLVRQQEKKYNLGNRFFYLATAAHFYCDITEHLGASGLVKRLQPKDEYWHRIVYEKPFGHDLESAHEINACIAKLFNESQIYRVDHYLTKELVSSIALVRFTNCVFEPLWNNQYIDQVQITLTETIGIESRGGYYDLYGALRDVVQNHMLQLLALTAMEPPDKLIGEFIRGERAKVLEKVHVNDVMLGQYKNYKTEKDVNPDSQTETFAVLYLTIDNPRWTGVPFFLKTGKKLNKKETAIHIRFKQVDCLLARNCPSEPNWLTIGIEPDARFLLSLNAKKPGETDVVVPVPMEFSHSAFFGPGTPTGYEVLLEEAIRGEQATSVRFDEIESAWRVIDEVKAKKFPLFAYEVGSRGPKESEEFEKKHDMRWRS